jgi:hypothetical protein
MAPFFAAPMLFDTGADNGEPILKAALIEMTKVRRKVVKSVM